MFLHENSMKIGYFSCKFMALVRVMVGIKHKNSTQFHAFCLTSIHDIRPNPYGGANSVTEGFSNKGEAILVN